MAKKKKEEKLICTCCGREQRLAEFYKSNSKLNKVTGKLPICKSCLNDRFNTLLTIYNGKHNEAWRHLCFNLDIFYDEELYLDCSTKDNFIGEYMRLVASTKDRKDRTSLNNTLTSNDINDVSLEDGIVSGDLVDFWGDEYTASEYRKLENKYKMYSEHYPNKRLQEQEMIKQLCELDLMKENCRKSKDRNGYDKICTQIRKTMDDLRILPKQSADENDQLTVGAIIKMIEYNEPIPDKNEEFNDVNGIEELINKYFVTPFKRVFGLKEKDFNGDINEN